ncbi:abnormal spindle-like microcephaly-associated -like protein [Brachionus plicatilis]|uniref:Abnormal spindle-like microcephaly-associated-like protein n=1 Tax=Brachionus plicatilis TaxID=10195 RepID=A0A3M7SXS7_BRAPC|nr:abnormal spindle-like microcephaly-associated -like protein [Brachionus plicatilis]
MGCASSKPSSSAKDKHKKNIKPKQSVENGSTGQLNGPEPAAPPPPTNTKPIRMPASLADQIEQHSQPVIDYIGHIVQRELNADLTNMASVVLAAAVAKDNADLIQDVAAKAVYLIANQNQNYRPDTYQQLNEALKAAQYLFKNQTNKNAIIDLTVNTIETSIDVINEEMDAHGSQFSLVEFLAKNGLDQSLTPPQTPQTNGTPRQPTESTPFIDWDNAQLLSRAQATEVARILFLSNKARPVVHASPKAKDAYVVNKQEDDLSEVALSRDEIEQILNSYDDQPKYVQLVDACPSIGVSSIGGKLNAMGVDVSGHVNEWNEEFTNVTHDETIQFASDTQESIQASELDAEGCSGEKDASLYVTTVITETQTCVLSPPLDADNLEKGQLDPSLKQSLLDDRFYNNDSFKSEAPVNGEEENQAATIIQSAFKGHEARQGEALENEPEDLGVNQNELDSESQKAATKIQATFRGFKTRKHLHHQKEAIGDKSKANSSYESTLASNPKASLDNKLEKSVDLNSTYSDNKNDLVADYIHNSSNSHSDTISDTPVCGMDSNKRDKEGLLERAATKIQSTFRGYKSRKVVKSTSSKAESASNCGTSLNTNPELAAIKIQSTFRGYKARKQLKPKLLKQKLTLSDGPNNGE